MSSFFRELKQRKVYRVAVGYAVVAWLLVQVSATVMPAYHAPEWVLPLFITAVALGFPVALVLAWAFDIKGGAIKKAPESTVPTVSGAKKIPTRRRIWARRVGSTRRSDQSGLAADATRHLTHHIIVRSQVRRRQGRSQGRSRAASRGPIHSR